MAETAKWYVVHTYSGYENKVAQNLEKTVQNRKLHDLIVDIKVPTETVIEIKDNKKREVERKIFPSYVLVKMVLTDDSWYVVRNTRGVTGFVGPGSKPVPLSETEMINLGFKKEAELSYDFEVGDTVTVISGAWENTQAVIRAINPHKQTVSINVDLFGRETPVEIGFSDIRVDN